MRMPKSCASLLAVNGSIAMILLSPSVTKIMIRDAASLFINRFIPTAMAIPMAVPLWVTALQDTSANDSLTTL